MLNPGTNRVFSSMALEHNWIQTIPNNGWNVILRLYGPLESWFDKTWKPCEIEEVT